MSILTSRSVSFCAITIPFLEVQDKSRLGVSRQELDWKNRTAVFGIVLGEKAHWGQGYGTDATRTMLRFAFEELNLHRVELEVFESNPRAARCYEKAGFQREGVRQQSLFRDGRYHDAHRMAILQEEFLSQENDTA